MATEQKGFSIGSLNAGADLSALQFGTVKVDASGDVVATSVAGEETLGVLQNKPTSGQVADVMTLGKTKARAGAAISAGALLMANASGKLITAATAGSHVIGVALEAAGAADVIFDAYVNCGAGVV